MAGFALLLCNVAASATTFSFTTDPFAGTPVLTAPGRQIVGGELFINFNTATDKFSFDRQVFNMGSQVEFANGPVGSIPANNVNVVVLQTTDNDANPLTPFGAGNAADLIATRVTQHGPGVFIYFNSSLNLPRLVYSTDLADNTADLRILARMLTLNGTTGNANNLASFTAANFEIIDAAATGAPEPSAFFLAGGGLLLVALAALRRNQRNSLKGENNAAY